MKDYSPVPESKFYRLLYPVVATVVTAQHEDEIGGMAAISYVALSFEPPLLGVSIDPDHQTHRLVSSSNQFAINWLDKDQSRAIAAMGSPTYTDVKDKIKESGFSHHKGKEIPVPILDEAVAAVECQTREKYSIGDHDLFIGEVVTAYAIPDFEEYWRYENYTPALYAGSEETKGGKLRLQLLSIR